MSEEKASYKIDGQPATPAEQAQIEKWLAKNAQTAARGRKSAPPAPVEEFGFSEELEEFGT